MTWKRKLGVLPPARPKLITEFRAEWGTLRVTIVNNGWGEGFAMYPMISVAGVFTVAMLAIIGAGPALAAYGALALDETTLKYGLSSNQDTQATADDVALKQCASSKCKIAFRTVARECGAIAIDENITAWGGAKRPQRTSAGLAANRNCQRRTKSQCKIRSIECNR